jgi:hypothetical protein
MTAPWVTEVRRIRNKGCSGTTLHSMNWKELLVGGIVNCALVRLPAFSQGRASSPEYFVRPVSQAKELLLRESRSSSSSVERGRTNSRETPPGALTTQPLTTRVPVSIAFPVRVTRWNEAAGITTLVAWDSNGTPDVLEFLNINIFASKEALQFSPEGQTLQFEVKDKWIL